MEKKENRPAASEELGPRDIVAEIRVLGRNLIMRADDPRQILELGPDIARLSAGGDPDLVDVHSADFRAGATLAYEVISNSLLEIAPSPHIIDFEG